MNSHVVMDHIERYFQSHDFLLIGLIMSHVSSLCRVSQYQYHSLSRLAITNRQKRLLTLIDAEDTKDAENVKDVEDDVCDFITG